MTDSSKEDNSLKIEKKKLIDDNFRSVKNIGLSSSELLPYVKEIEHIRSIEPKLHASHILNLKDEINNIYDKVTGDSEDLDSYDGKSIYGGSVGDNSMYGGSDLESESSDSDNDSMYGGSVYGSVYGSDDDEEDYDEEDYDDEKFDGGFINQTGGEQTTDLVDLLVQKRLALKGIIFLHNYEKKYKNSYIEKQGEDKGKTYLDTLNIANIYLMKFGFSINANNIHMFNLIWECFYNVQSTKMATLYVIMYMANNNEKYKIFVKDFESGITSDKVMFYVLGVLYSSLNNKKGVESNEEEIKDAFKKKDWTSVDWSFNYINQIFWTVSMKRLIDKRKFLKSYLQFGFSTVAVIVSNNLNKHLENNENLIDFFLNGEYKFEDNSLTNLDESKCNSDLFSKLFLIFASLDFKQNNKDHIPFGLINHFTKTPSFVSWKPVRKMPILKYFKKLKFGSNKRRKNFTAYVKAKKELLFEEQMNDLILSVVYGQEKLESDYVLKGGGLKLDSDITKRRNQNEDMINLTSELDEKIRQVKSNDLDKLVTEMTKKEKVRILKSMKIKPELLTYNDNKVISLKDIYNLGNMFLTKFLLELLMNHPSTQLIFDTQIINVRKNGYKEHKFKDGSDENMDKNLAIQNFSGKFMDKNGTLFLFFCCNKDESSKGLSKYQKSLHLFQTLKKNVSLKNYFHEPNIHLAVKIVTTEKSSNDMKNKIDSFPLQVIRLKNPYIFDTGSWLKPGLQLFFRSSNAKEKIKAEKEATRLQVKINQKKYKKNKNAMKRQKKIDKLEDNKLVLITKINAAKDSGKTLKMTKLKRKLKNNKRQLRKMKKKMKEEEKDADDEIKELHDLRLQTVDRLNRFTRPMEDSVLIRDEGAEKDYTDSASGITMKKKGKKIDSPAEEDGKKQQNNPIYGIANGGNTCFFASALQVIFSLSKPTVGQMLDDSIVKATDIKEQCKEILTVVQKIHNKTKINMRNKVIQTADYFPDIKKISDYRILNWGWVKGWGGQQDAGEVITTLVSECMEDSFKQPVVKYSLYQHEDSSLKRLNKISDDGNLWREPPVIQLDGNDFDEYENISCQNLLNMTVPKDIDEKKSFYQKIIGVREDYKKYSNPKLNIGNLKITRQDQNFSIPGITWLVLSEIDSLYNRYMELEKNSLLHASDVVIFKSFFNDLDGYKINDMRAKLQSVYRACLKKLIIENMEKQNLDYDNSAGKFYVKSDFSRKPKVLTIIKKNLEECVHNDENDEVKVILRKIPNFDIILKNIPLVNLLKRITHSPAESKLFDTPYLFILPQLIKWGNSASKRLDMEGKFQYPNYIDDTFKYNKKNYQLIGVVYHSGYAGGGHYIAEVLREGKLYLCNDSSTKIITHWNTFSGINIVPSVFLFQEMKVATTIGGRKTKKRVNKRKNRTKRRRKK